MIEPNPTQKPADARPRPPARFIQDAAISVAFCGLVVLLMLLVDPIDSMTTPETAFDGGQIVAADWIYVGRFVAGSLLRAFAAFFQWRTRRSRILICVPLIAFLALGAMTIDGELRLARASVFRERFDASRIELDLVIARIRAGEQLPIGVRVGAFHIFSHEQVGETVFLYTKTDARLEHRWGFAYAPTAAPSGQTMAASELGMAEPFGSRHLATPLGNEWFVIYDRYVFIKRGWS